MKFRRRLLAACIGASLFCLFLNAQQQPVSLPSPAVVPRLVNFSGKATDANGRIITGIAGATFAIYKGQSDGALLWMETQNVTADAKGNYTVQLGATKPEGLPLELFTSGEARWLGVTINGGSEQPRILLLSVPYALKAADSETLGGLPASAFVRATSDAAQGSNSSGASGSSQGAGVASGGPLGPQTLLGVKTISPGNIVGFLPVWSGSKNPTVQLSASALFQSGSNVGLGTISPATSLDVFSSSAGLHAPIAQFGSSGTGDCNSVRTYTGNGEAEVFVAQPGCFVPGAAAGDGGLRVETFTKMILGDANTARLTLDTAGNAAQPRTAGGTVKAMALVDQGGVTRCFNSTLSGAAATTPPCNFSFDKTGPGDYIVDFQFQVNDRFVSATAGGAGGFPVVGPTITACVLGLGGQSCNNTVTKNQVEVTNLCAASGFICSNHYTDNQIFVIIY